MKSRPTPAETSAKGRAEPDARPAGASAPSPSRAPLAIVIAWLVMCIALVAMGTVGRSIEPELEALLPAEHRTPSGRGHLLLVHDGTLPRDELLTLADRVHESLGDAWSPIAAPSAEVAGWLDAHALYLLPVSTHEQLAERLTGDHIREAVEALRANMSSPFFALTMAEARRDPLRLREMTAEVSGQDVWAAPSIGRKASSTPAGDLLAHDGRTLLLEYRSEQTPGALASRVQTVVGDEVRVHAVGPLADAGEVASSSRAQLVTVALTTLAGVLILVAAAVRRVRPAAALVACVGSGALACLAFVPFDPLSAAWFALVIGVGFQGAALPEGWRARVRTGLILAVALLPLLFSDYPLWQRWSSMHAAVVLVLAVLVGIVLPALQTVLGSPPHVSRGFLLRPARAMGVLLVVATLGAGAWGMRELEPRGADRLNFGERDHAASLLREHYFDPGRIARVHTESNDAAGALSLASEDAELLASLVPTEAVQIDTPGALVLPDETLQRRQVALAKLELGERLGVLREALKTRGFRPDAFGEFLRSAADPDQLPTPAAALEGPLGRWVHRYLGPGQTTDVALESFVHLAPNPDVLAPTLQTRDGRELRLQGPAIGGRLQRNAFVEDLLLIVTGQLWLAALIIWLATRSLSIAFASAMTGLATHAGIIGALGPLGLPLSPVLFPVLLLCGASAAAIAAQACVSVRDRKPLDVTRLLLASACQGVVAMALAASDVPVWSQMGVAAALGAALACGVGVFAAPGLAALTAGGAKP